MDKLIESMRACNEILKELFSKKHSVSTTIILATDDGLMF
jgi:hypothetical protein